MPVYSSKKVPVFMGFRYGREVLIENNTANDYNDTQIEIVLNTQELINSNKLKNNCSDLVIVDENLNMLPFWIQKETINTTQTRIWTKLSFIQRQSTQRIFVYYNDPEFVNIQNPDSVFIFFDDFNGPSGSPPNSQKWWWNGNPRLDGNSWVILGGDNNGANIYGTQMDNNQILMDNNQILRARANFNGSGMQLGLYYEIRLVIDYNYRYLFCYRYNSCVQVESYSGVNIVEIQRFPIDRWNSYAKYYKNYVEQFSTQYAYPSSLQIHCYGPASYSQYLAIDWIFLYKNACKYFNILISNEEPTIKRSFLIQPIF
ncbi:MAG: DUF2341 domain-containing protein [Thermoplasmata archaeon]